MRASSFLANINRLATQESREYAELCVLNFEHMRFSRQIRKLMKVVPEKEVDLIKALGVKVIQGVVPRTPVRTGRARAGWWRAATAFAFKAPEMVISAMTGGDRTGVAEGMEMGEYSDNFIGPNKYIEIINAVWYIVLLEFGRSSQAPDGMLRVTMREIRADIQYFLRGRGGFFADAVRST